MSDEKLRDLRSLDTLYQQAEAWEKVFDFCRSLGARQSGSAVSSVLNFISALHDDAAEFQRLHYLLGVIHDGDMNKIYVQGEGVEP